MLSWCSSIFRHRVYFSISLHNVISWHTAIWWTWNIHPMFISTYIFDWYGVRMQPVLLHMADIFVSIFHPSYEVLCSCYKISKKTLFTTLLFHSHSANLFGMFFLYQWRHLWVSCGTTMHAHYLRRKWGKGGRNKPRTLHKTYNPLLLLFFQPPQWGLFTSMWQNSVKFVYGRVY